MADDDITNELPTDQDIDNTVNNPDSEGNESQEVRAGDDALGAGQRAGPLGGLPGQDGNARRMPHLPGFIRHSYGDVRKLFAIRPFMDCHISYEYCPTPRNNNRCGHKLAVFGWANYSPYMFETWLESASYARD